MKYEALLWLGLLLSSPLLFVLSRMLGAYIWAAFFPVEKVTLIVTDEHGNQKEKTLSLDKSSEVLELIASIKKERNKKAHG